MIYNLGLAIVFCLAIMSTAAWILKTTVMAVTKSGTVSAMQTIWMSFSWALFCFLWLQK